MKRVLAGGMAVMRPSSSIAALAGEMSRTQLANHWKPTSRIQGVWARSSQHCHSLHPSWQPSSLHSMLA